MKTLKILLPIVILVAITLFFTRTYWLKEPKDTQITATETTEECIQLENSKLCLRETIAENDFWGHKSKTDFIKVEESTDTRTLVYSKQGFAPRLLGMSTLQDKIYYSTGAYESSGTGRVFMLDLIQSTTTEVDVNVYGEVSPNKKYYATFGDTLIGDNGSIFCNNPDEHSGTLPASAIRILNFDTGIVKIFKEDRESIFEIKSWGSDSNSLTYIEKRSLNRKSESDGCPEYLDGVEGQLEVKF